MGFCGEVEARVRGALSEAHSPVQIRRRLAVEGGHPRVRAPGIRKGMVRLERQSLNNGPVPIQASAASGEQVTLAANQWFPTLPMGAAAAKQRLTRERLLALEQQTQLTEDL